MSIMCNRIDGKIIDIVVCCPYGIPKFMHYGNYHEMCYVTFLVNCVCVDRRCLR